jgi:hypothetical protein
MRKIVAIALVGAMSVPALSSAQLAPTGYEEGKDEYALPTHQFSGGFGMPICAFAVGSEWSGAGCVSSELLWFNLPFMYHYRVNDWFAAGGGLMVNIFAFGGFGMVGAELMGGVRFYALPDYIYFDLRILLGYPYFFAFMPSLGLSLPLTDSVSLFLENQVPMLFVAGLIGFWQPVLGVEFKF